MAELPETMSVEEVAKLLDVSHETVRYWYRQGKLRGFKKGGRTSPIRITTESVERYLEELRRQASDAQQR